MIRTELRLSLSNWPTNPLPQNRFRLSPNTCRTLKNAQIEAEAILPISLAEFRISHNLLMANNTEVFQLYEEDKERRNRKIDILRGLWEKICKKKEQRKSSASAKSSVTFKRESLFVGKNSLRKQTKHSRSSKKSVSPLIFKAQSPKNNVAYSDYYSLAEKEKKIKNRLHTEDQSTKSRQRQEATKTGEYFETSSFKKKNRAKSPTLKDTVFLMMNDVMKRWTDLDEKHSNENDQLKNVSEREKKRLQKIHKIQKEKLRVELDNVKANITANRKLSKHFL